ncbi:natural resistance-associated macrophage protein [Chloropicon primus]|uniref:Natural resistance-associated macrophage protein n=1 Tax=Chloropicon primus TaxID=1764295 RepID=A0A5B8MUU2_9CHLO|nr:natural resistance-associated macrophage protein [Chloropicon primus]UPR02383.1 natural resistance-associated macrophage protein [Chloropicon primus]|eukprot:QDZ23170.1 natural resistance-associated macrophage protein [Chloropicon primus]
MQAEKGHARAPAGKEEGSIVIDQKGTNWSKFLQFLGPGILIAVVYVDPGQITVDMESGSVFQYKLLWALVVSNLIGLLFQHVCTRLSITTGRNLAEENRLEYPWKVRIFLWFSVELASIAADVGYVMGTAIALEILTGMPLHYGVLITGLDTFLALGLQYFGIRTVEMIVGLLFGAVLLCYLVEIFMVSPSIGGILDGLVPRLWHSNENFGVKTWVELLCANLGAAVCPPNFFLQSALVNVRSIEKTERAVREAFAFNLAETSLCLFLATLVNIVMLILAASEFYPERVVSLSQGADLLGNTLGGSASMAFATAMLCAGQSSSLTGVLSTQYIMEGFFEMTVPGWVVRLVTRVIAILPAFLIVYTYGPNTAADLIEKAQVVVNLVVPFTVIPLTKFLCSELKMGVFVLPRWLQNACWASAVAALVLNLFSITETLSSLTEYETVNSFLTVCVTGFYLAFSFYLAGRPVRVDRDGKVCSMSRHGSSNDVFDWLLGSSSSRRSAAAGGGGSSRHPFTRKEMIIAIAAALLVGVSIVSFSWAMLDKSQG